MKPLANCWCNTVDGTTITREDGVHASWCELVQALAEGLKWEHLFFVRSTTNSVTLDDAELMAMHQEDNPSCLNCKALASVYSNSHVEGDR